MPATMAVVTLGQLLAIISVLVALVSLLMVWLNRHIDAKTDTLGKVLEARAEGIGRTLDAKIACVQEAVATGAEEHKAWREELAKTNKRLDEELAKTNKRLDDLLMHLMSRDNAK